MMTATLTQKEYATFKRKVKVTLLKEYDIDELERLSGGVK